MKPRLHLRLNPRIPRGAMYVAAGQHRWGEHRQRQAWDSRPLVQWAYAAVIVVVLMVRW